MKKGKHVAKHLRKRGRGVSPGAIGTLRVVAAVVVVLAILAAAYIILKEFRAQRKYDSLVAAVSSQDASVQQGITPAATPAITVVSGDTNDNDRSDDTPQAGPTPLPLGAPVNNPIDFQALLNMNSDVVGWINVDGTDINYPVLMSEGYYYLSHTFDKKLNGTGAICMLGYNQPDFSDFCTVLYGHTLVKGSMFSGLHQFEDKSFFDSHDTVTIYTPDRLFTYKIFAAYQMEDLNISTSFDFSTSETRTAYLEQIYSEPRTIANFRKDITVSESDRIITLSTCMPNPEYRLIVQGVLVSQNEAVFGMS